MRWIVETVPCRWRRPARALRARRGARGFFWSRASHGVATTGALHAIESRGAAALRGCRERAAKPAVLDRGARRRIRRDAASPARRRLRLRRRARERPDLGRLSRRCASCCPPLRSSSATAAARSPASPRSGRTRARRRRAPTCMRGCCANARACCKTPPGAERKCAARLSNRSRSLARAVPRARRNGARCGDGRVIREAGRGALGPCREPRADRRRVAARCAATQLPVLHHLRGEVRRSQLRRRVARAARAGARPAGRCRRGGGHGAARPRAPKRTTASARALRESKKEQEEHAAVVRALREALEPLCAGLDVPEAPRLLRLEGIQHLETPIARPLRRRRAPARPRRPAASDARPSRGAPRDAALAWLAAHEALARGWYARRRRLARRRRGRRTRAWPALARCCAESDAQLYAGAGIVAGSRPEAELAETRLKLRALLRRCWSSEMRIDAPANRSQRATSAFAAALVDGAAARRRAARLRLPGLALGAARGRALARTPRAARLDRTRRALGRLLRARPRARRRARPWRWSAPRAPPPRTSCPRSSRRHYARVPLLVLTADRPPELRDCGAAQTIDQVRLFGSHVRWFAEAAARRSRARRRCATARALAGRAVADARGPPRRARCT